MKSTTLPYILFLPLLLFPSLLHAQTDTQDSLSLQPVEITATRSPALSTEVPAAISVVERNDIQELKPGFSVEESLRQVPGVFINNRYNFSQGERISIRGLGSRAQFGVRSIKIVLDGIPLTFADGTTQLNNLDPGFIGRMEVLRGPASTLYGNAAGGVIYIESLTPDTGKVVLTPRITAGSYGFYKLQSQLSGHAGKTSFLVSADGVNYNGYRDFSESRLYHFNSVLTYKPSAATRLSFILNLMHAPYLYNPSSLNLDEWGENPRQARLAVQRQASGKTVWQGQTGIGLQKDFGNWGKLKSSVFGISRDLYNPIFGRIIDLQRIAGGTHNVYSKAFHLGEYSILSWMLGFDVEYQSDQREEFENPGLSEAQLASASVSDRIRILPRGNRLLAQREQVLSAGAFSLLKWNWKKLSLSAGLRSDWFRFKVQDKMTAATEEGASFNRLSPSAGLLYRLGKSWQTYINYSTAFQTPTANEFSNDPQGGRFNRSLRPEYVQSIEGGLRKEGRKFNFGAAAFYFTVEDQLIPYQLSAQSDEVFYRNAGKTSNRGVEVWMQFRLSEMLKLYGSYTFMHYRFDDYWAEASSGLFPLQGNFVPGVPAHQFFAELDYEHPKGFLAEVNAQFVGGYFANDFNGPEYGTNSGLSFWKNEAYFLLDLRLGYKIERKKAGLTVFGGIINLLNTQYSSSIVPNAAADRYFEPAPGRNYYVGLSVPVVVK